MKLLAITNYGEFGDQLLKKDEIYYTVDDGEEKCNHVKVRCEGDIVRFIHSSLFNRISK